MIKLTTGSQLIFYFDTYSQTHTTNSLLTYLLAGRSMLQRLMQLLLEDEKQAANEKESEDEVKRLEKINNAKAERERKKQEAIERSKARQRDPSYFDTKVESNVAPAKPNLDGLEEVNGEANQGEGESEDNNDFDPFSFNSNKSSRGKIHFNF